MRFCGVDILMRKKLHIFLRVPFKPLATSSTRRFLMGMSVAGSLAFLPTAARAQELIVNGTFSNGLTGWTQANWGSAGSIFGVNSNGPTSTAAASGNYAYAGGGAYNLLQQSIGGVTNGGTYRLRFLAGSKSGQGASALLSLHDGLAGSYNSASFDYRPSDASFGNYTVDFVARGPTDLWLRSDGGTYAAYADVSLTPIAGVVYALNYSNSAAGYTEITSPLSGTGKVAVHTAGSGAGLTFWAANTYSGGTEVTGGRLYVSGDGTLGAATGAVTVNDAILDLRNQQTRIGAISITNNGFILSGTGTGSLVNNGGDLQFGGGSLEVSLSGSGGMNVTGGGRITSSNSYTGVTTISGTSGWFGTHTLHLVNPNALGEASGDLTISGGTVDLQNNTITRSGNLTISGGTINSGTISKSGSNYDVQGGVINAALAGTAGLTKSGAGNAAVYGSNSYGGDTVINQGILVVGSAEGLGNAAAAVTVNSGGALYLGGGLTVERTGNLTLNGGKLISDNTNLATIRLSSGGSFIASAGTNAAEFAAKLAGTGGLTVGGTGDTWLWAPNSYTGATVVNSGRLLLGGTGAIAESSAVQIASSAAFVLTGDYAPNNINRTIAGLTGGGVLWGGGGTVTVNKASGTDIFTGQIQGDQGLIKSGAGELVLTGLNSYSGTTTVTDGSLVISNNVLTATIQPNSLTVNFASTPTAGTYNILPGSLATASLGSTTVTVAGGSLPAGLTATIDNSSNLAVVVQSAPTQTPQETYLASYGLSGTDLLGTADPDGDGMDNSAEFAFGTSPVSGASRAATLSSGTGQIKLTYLQRKSGVTYTVKSLPNLTTVFDSGTSVTPSLSADQANLPSADYERYEATLSTGSSRGFLRVKAVQ
jgi:autotransporter-associated beta strand protein